MQKDSRDNLTGFLQCVVARCFLDRPVNTDEVAVMFPAGYMRWATASPSTRIIAVRRVVKKIAILPASKRFSTTLAALAALGYSQREAVQLAEKMWPGSQAHWIATCLNKR